MWFEVATEDCLVEQKFDKLELPEPTDEDIRK